MTNGHSRAKAMTVCWIESQQESWSSTTMHEARRQTPLRGRRISFGVVAWCSMKDMRGQVRHKHSVRVIASSKAIHTFPWNSSDTTFTEKSDRPVTNRIVRTRHARPKRSKDEYVRVSPLPPPSALIGAWCLCCHESFLMSSCEGFRSSVSYQNRHTGHEEILLAEAYG